MKKRPSKNQKNQKNQKTARVKSRNKTKTKTKKMPEMTLNDKQQEQNIV